MFARIAKTGYKKGTTQEGRLDTGQMEFIKLKNGEWVTFQMQGTQSPNFNYIHSSVFADFHFPNFDIFDCQNIFTKFTNEQLQIDVNKIKGGTAGSIGQANFPLIIEGCRLHCKRDVATVITERYNIYKREIDVSEFEKEAWILQTREVLKYRADQQRYMSPDLDVKNEDDECSSDYLRKIANAKGVKVSALVESIERKMAEHDNKIVYLKSCEGHIHKIIDSLGLSNDVAGLDDFLGWDVDKQFSQYEAIYPEHQSAEDILLLGKTTANIVESNDISDFPSTAQEEKADEKLNKTDAKIKLKANKIKEQPAAITA